jgi:hypothetical protein
MEGILAGPHRPALPFSFVVKRCCHPPPFLSGDRGGRPLRGRRIGGAEAGGTRRRVNLSVCDKKKGDSVQKVFLKKGVQVRSV